MGGGGGGGGCFPSTLWTWVDALLPVCMRGSFLLLSGLHLRHPSSHSIHPISALQVAGISPSESRSCDYISPPCIYASRTTLYFYFYMASSIHISYDDDDKPKNRGREGMQTACLCFL